MARPKTPGRSTSRRSVHDSEAKADAARSRPRPRAAEEVLRADSEAMRQAECAAMLIAVTRMLLNLRGRDFAIWLRSIADDFASTDPDLEHPDDLTDELIRMGSADTAGAEPDDDADGLPPPAGARRPH